MTHVARARKERGAKLVVIDPYRTPTAAVADHASGASARYRCRAGLRRDACGVPRWLRRSCLHARATPTARTGWRRICAARGRSGRRRSPAVRLTQIESFAALYGRTKRSYLRAGYGFARSRNGAAAMHAVSCLPTVTGAWQHEGGGALWSNRGMYHWNKTLIEGLDARDTSIRELDMSRIGSVLTGDRTRTRRWPAGSCACSSRTRTR